ncbi:hypothetical protein [Streptomyces sp. TLI_171]|nr:hypothetical protein [Streptomyces sp. TLI_171]RKE18970.1 hypothetical protein BX266_2268 [Streptomyces sp. TLI_171]
MTTRDRYTAPLLLPAGADAQRDCDALADLLPADTSTLGPVSDPENGGTA